MYAEEDYEQNIPRSDDEIAKGDYTLLLKIIQGVSLFTFIIFNIMTLRGKDLRKQKGIVPALVTLSH